MVDPDASMLIESTSTTYDKRRRTLLANVPVVAVALALGTEDRIWPSNVAWTSLLAAYVVVSLLLIRLYFARPITPLRARRWVLVLHVSLATLALIYNAIFLNLARHGVPNALEYLALIVAFFCAGGAAAYQYLRGLAVTFIVFGTVPQMIYYTVTGEGGGRLMAVVLLVFAVFISLTSQTLHLDFVQRMKLTRELAAATQAAERMARHDHLTNLLNRRALLEVGSGLVAAAQRYKRPLSVALLDLDRFKSINDRYGHASGDAALVAVAEVLRGALRESDVASRIGGEEIAIVMPETDAAGAAQVAERLRERIGRCAPIADAPAVTLSASFGVAQLGDAGSSLEALLQRADAALYQAKSEGRDRVVVAAQA